MARACQRAASGRRLHRAVLGLTLLGLTACVDGSFVPDSFEVLSDTVNGGNGRAFHTAAADGGGDVFLVGGQDAAGLPLNDVFFAERYRWGIRTFVGEDAFPSATGRVAPLAVVVGGLVVAAGGQASGVTAAATAPQYLPLTPPAVPDGEEYDPATATTRDFTLAGGVAGAALVRGPFGDRYLIGGRDETGALRDEILRYSSLSGSFVGTGNNLLAGREGHTATRLATGEILIVGGWGSGGVPLQSAELFDPATDTVAAATTPLLARAGHTATANADGSKVLLYGGFKDTGVLAGVVAPTEVAEVYDAAAGTFRAVTSDPVPTPRVYHSATLLDNGDVLIAGGVVDASGTVTDTAQVFRPETETVRDTAGTLAFPRFGHTATVVPDGSVLVAGGLSAPGSLVPEAERYFPEVR